MTNLSSIVVLLELALQLLSNKTTANNASTRLLVAQAMSLATESLSQPVAQTIKPDLLPVAPVTSTPILNPYDGQYYAGTSNNKTLVSQINAQETICAQDSANLQTVAAQYLNQQGITDIGRLLSYPDYFAADEASRDCLAQITLLNQKLIP